jgi:hypothetical protein
MMHGFLITHLDGNINGLPDAGAYSRFIKFRPRPYEGAAGLRRQVAKARLENPNLRWTYALQDYTRFGMWTIIRSNPWFPP